MTKLDLIYSKFKLDFPLKIKSKKFTFEMDSYTYYGPLKANQMSLSFKVTCCCWSFSNINQLKWYKQKSK